MPVIPLHPDNLTFEPAFVCFCIWLNAMSNGNIEMAIDDWKRLSEEKRANWRQFYDGLKMIGVINVGNALGA